MSRMIIAHWRFSRQGSGRAEQHRTWRIFPALVLLTLLTLAGCSGAAAQAKTRITPTATPAKYIYGNYPPQEPNPFAYVTFTPSTSYVDALRAITDLGLQPVDPCIGTNEGSHVEWVPTVEAKNYD